MLCYRGLSRLNGDELPFGLESPLVLIAYVVATSAVMVTLATLLAPRAPRKEPYRLLEVGGESTQLSDPLAGPNDCNSSAVIPRA